MNSEAIFEEIFEELSSEDVKHDWTAISEGKSENELAGIRKIIQAVCCDRLDYFIAGKEVEKLISPQKTSNFRNFLLKFDASFQHLPFNEQNHINCTFLLKLLHENVKNPENPLNFSKIVSFSEIMQRSVNIMLKDLLENAINLYPKNGKRRKINGRDILDGVVLSDNPNLAKFQDPAFLRLKMKLQNQLGEKVSKAERSILKNEVSLYGQIL